MKSGRKLLALSLMAISAATMFFVSFPSRNREARALEADAKAPLASSLNNDDTPLAIKAARVKRGDLVIRIKAPGEAVAERKITMRAEIPGVLKRLLAKEGLRVEKGDLLAELDDRECRLKLERLEALRLSALSAVLLENQMVSSSRDTRTPNSEKLAKAEEEFTTAEALFKDGMLSGADFEKAQKDYERILIETGMKKNEIMAATKGLTQSEVDVKIVRMELEKAVIRAPFSGIVTGIKVVPEEHVETGTELFILVDISRIKVLARILESNIGKIKAGREAVLRFTPYPREAFKGTVTAISPVFDPEEKTCTVHIAIGNPREKIWPGMHAEAEITSDVLCGRLLVPREAVLERGGRKLVFAVEGGLAKWRYIEVGLENERYAEVLEGVKEGEIVAVEGHLTLGHDAHVNLFWQ